MQKIAQEVLLKLDIMKETGKWQNISWWWWFSAKNCNNLKSFNLRQDKHVHPLKLDDTTRAFTVDCVLINFLFFHHQLENGHKNSLRTLYVHICTPKKTQLNTWLWRSKNAWRKVTCTVWTLKCLHHFKSALFSPVYLFYVMWTDKTIIRKFTFFLLKFSDIIFYILSQHDTFENQAIKVCSKLIPEDKTHG